MEALRQRGSAADDAVATPLLATVREIAGELGYDGHVANDTLHGDVEVFASFKEP